MFFQFLTFTFCGLLLPVLKSENGEGEKLSDPAKSGCLRTKETFWPDIRLKQTKRSCSESHTYKKYKMTDQLEVSDTESYQISNFSKAFKV